MEQLTRLSATALRAHLSSREVSVREVVEAHLDSIAHGEAVNAMVTIDAEGARRQADALDAQGPQPDQPLFGLPVGIKDTHDTAHLRTTYGSVRHAAHVPTRDALHVQRMRGAGAVVLGKTNVPEYAAGSHSVNRVFGATANPYALDRSAGGSSGGAAAALAARQIALADGSDMGGSLRNPASFCNIVGLRPSPGLVPLAESGNILTPLTTAGPMGRYVDDVALLLSVIGRPDPHTPAPVAPDAREHRWAGGTESQPLRGIRMAWAPDLGGATPVEREVTEVLAKAVRQCADLGADIIETSPNLAGAAETFVRLRAAEFEAEWGHELDVFPEDFNERMRWNIELGRTLSGHDVLRAQEQQTSLLREGARFFSEYDVLLAPAVSVAPFPIEWDYPREVAGEQQQHYLDWMRAATTITMLGVPALSVPAGFTASGLPIGLQMVSAHGTDYRLLDVARAYEQATRFADRVPEI